MTTNFFFTPLFCSCFWIRDPGSEIRDLGSGMDKNQDPGSGINIPDPQHLVQEWANMPKSIDQTHDSAQG